MASVTRTEYIDDLDGKTIAEGDAVAIEFALEGKRYVIDLSSDNAHKFRETLAPYVNNAKRLAQSTARVGSTRGRNGGATGKAARASRPQTGAASENAAIREWARANGHDVGERGRIKNEVIEAYRRR